MIRLCVALLATGAMATLFFGWLGALHPFFDSFTTFRHVFLAGTLVMLGLCALMRLWRMVVAGLLVSAVSIVLSLPYLPGIKRGWAVANAIEPDGATVTLVQANLRFNNDQLQRVADILETSDADVIALQEISPHTRPLLGLLGAEFPHQAICDERTWHYTAILSRLPFVPGRDIGCAQATGATHATIDIAGREISIASVHLFWPWPYSQDRHITGLAPFFRSMPAALRLVAGDFNAAPWSHAAQRIGGDSETRLPSGVIWTWQPTAGGRLSRLIDLAIPILPLDHAFASQGLGLMERRTLDHINSDHLPVLTRWVVLPAAKEPRS